MIGFFKAASSSAVHSFPSLFLCSCVMVARTPAACSPPMTDILELGHMYRNLGS